MSDISNPPAFPLFCVPGDIQNTSGMELRDYFAAAALQGWRANPQGRYTTHQDAAEEAYAYAEAMLRARAI